MGRSHLRTRPFLAWALCLCLLSGLAARAAGSSAVNIFRVQIDRPNPGDFYNAIQEVNYQGTIFFRSTASDDIHDVQLKVTMYDRRQHVYSDSRTYAMGTVSPGQIVEQNYRIPLASEVYLVPVASVTWTLGGVRGETHTSPYEDFY